MTYIEKEIKPLKIQDTIKNIKSKDCFGTLSYGTDSIDLCICPDKIFWPEVAIGDSLIKNPGSDSLLLKKKNGHNVSILFPCCDH